MRVLHISIWDRLGGACIAGYRQHQALRQAGVDSRMWVKYKVTKDSTVTAFQPSLKLRPRVARVLRRSLISFQWRRAKQKSLMFDARSDHGDEIFNGMPSADLINIQFAWKLINYSSFFTKLNEGIPVVITMHEMSNFTGGCVYAGPCRRFEQQCGDCPQLSNRYDHDLSFQGWRYRFKGFQQTGFKKLHFVADSHWLAAEARKSSLLKNYPLSVIYYGIDSGIYRPLPKANAKEGFGIPAHFNVIAFAADSVADPRKGILPLAAALQGMKERPFLLTWGRDLPTALEGLPHLHLGNIESEHLMAIAYSAADVFVMPSLEEAFGQTALEASACGVPVVAFAAGGIPEIVRDGETGILAPVGDVRALRGALEKLLEDAKLRTGLGIRGVEVAREKFSFQKNSESYIKLYQSMLDGRG